MTKLTCVIAMLSTAGAAVAGDAKAPDQIFATLRPPTEIADMLKGKAGTWKCDGMSRDITGTEMKLTGKLTSKSDLDGWWIHDTFDGTIGGSAKLRFESFVSYDATSKRWNTFMVDNQGGTTRGTSDGMKEMKMDVTGDSTGPMSKGQFKDHIDASDMKKGVRIWGEDSHDGKTWNKVYDMTCKR